MTESSSHPDKDGEVRRHERRVVGHASGWQEQMDTCICGKPWPCPSAVSHVAPNAEPFVPLHGKPPAWLILFDDRDKPVELFSGAGAEEGAHRRFAEASTNWNCHLFSNVEAPQAQGSNLGSREGPARPAAASAPSTTPRSGETPRTLALNLRLGHADDATAQRAFHDLAEQLERELAEAAREIERLLEAYAEEHGRAAEMAASLRAESAVSATRQSEPEFSVLPARPRNPKPTDPEELKSVLASCRVWLHEAAGAGAQHAPRLVKRIDALLRKLDAALIRRADGGKEADG